MRNLIKNLPDLLLITLTTIPIICLAWWLNGSLLGIDDADIIFTYAENLAAGNGIIYSKTIPLVEGYSSMLWMMLSSLIFYAGYSEIGIFLVTCLLFLITQFVALKIIDSFDAEDDSFIKLAYITLTVTSFGYVSWSTVTLMDVTAWGLIVNLLVYNFTREPKGGVGWVVFCLPFILAPITRPEALLIVPGFLFLYGLFRITNRLAKKPILIGSIIFVSSCIFITIFRYFYFGYFLPNTYYAKVSPSFTYNLTEGFLYLKSFLIVSPVATISILLSTIFSLYLLFNFFKGRLNNHYSTPYFHLFYFCIFSFLLLLVPALNGGDHFNLHRFYQPFYPLLVICLLLTYRSLLFLVIKNKVINSFIYIPLLLPIVFFALKANLFGPGGWVEAYKNKSQIAHEFHISQKGRNLGAHLNVLFQDTVGGQPSIGVITAGGIARRYQGPIYDLMGLNNAYIAHHPGDRRGFKNHAAFEKDAFFNLPINIVPESPDNRFVEIALKGLFQDPRFFNEWRYGTFSKLNGNGDQSLEGFFRKEYLKGVILQKNYVFVDSKVFNQSKNQWVAIEK